MTQARTTAISAAIVATVAIGFALHLGRVVFIPIALALVLAALLAPLVSRLERARIPAPVGATLLLLGTVALVVGTGLALSGPVQDWAHKTPEAIAAAGKKVQASATGSIESVRSSHHRRVPPAPSIRLAEPPHLIVRTEPRVPSSRPHHLNPRPLNPASHQSLAGRLVPQPKSSARLPRQSCCCSSSWQAAAPGGTALLRPQVRQPPARRWSAFSARCSGLSPDICWSPC
jgi:Predicted permease